MAVFQSQILSRSLSHVLLRNLEAHMLDLGKSSMHTVKEGPGEWVDSFRASFVLCQYLAITCILDIINEA